MSWSDWEDTEEQIAEVHSYHQHFTVSDERRLRYWNPERMSTTLSIDLTNKPMQNEALRLMFGGYGPEPPPEYLESGNAPED